MLKGEGGMKIFGLDSLVDFPSHTRDEQEQPHRNQSGATVTNTPGHSLPDSVTVTCVR